MKRSLLCATLAFALGLGALPLAAKTTQSDPWEYLQPDREQVIASLNVVELLKRHHYNKPPLDDERSVKIYQGYLKMLDPARSYFTAGDIARRDQLTVVERSGMRLRAALSRLDQSGRQVAVVNDRARVLQGVVTVDSIAQQLESSVGGKDGYIESAFIDDPPILASTPLTDIMTRVAESPWPVPVVDDEGHYVGAISRATLLLTLDRQDPEASEEEASHGA